MAKKQKKKRKKKQGDKEKDSKEIDDFLNAKIAENNQSKVGSILAPSYSSI